MKRFGKIALCLGLSLGMFTTIDSSNFTIEAKAKKPYQIGQTVKVKGMKITVNGIRDVGVTPLESPEDGKMFLAVDCTIENDTSNDVTSSSIMWYSVKGDDGRKCDQIISAELNGSLDTDIASGEVVAGEVCYEVPTEGSLYLTFKPTFSTKSARIQIR